MNLHPYCQDSSVKVSNSTKIFWPCDRELVIIDAGVEDYRHLVSGIKAGIDWVILNPEFDGIEQITEILRNRRGTETLHILSHGSPGCLFLGNTQLSLETLDRYARELQKWFLEVPCPNLFIYGCQVASGNRGTGFLTKLKTLTKANIAASANLTGNAALGGDWELEISLGEGQFVPAFTSESLATYSSVLDSGNSLVLPSFATKWLDKNNPVPNVSVTETASEITAIYNGTLDITANINEILAKLKLSPITQQISVANPNTATRLSFENL